MRNKVIAYNKELKEALVTIFAELNHGQQQKLLRNTKVLALFKRYGIMVAED